TTANRRLRTASTVASNSAAAPHPICCGGLAKGLGDARAGAGPAESVASGTLSNRLWELSTAIPNEALKSTARTTNLDRIAPSSRLSRAILDRAPSILVVLTAYPRRPLGVRSLSTSAEVTAL